MEFFLPDLAYPFAAAYLSAPDVKAAASRHQQNLAQQRQKAGTSGLCQEFLQVLAIWDFSIWIPPLCLSIKKHHTFLYDNTSTINKNVSQVHITTSPCKHTYKCVTYQYNYIYTTYFI